MAHFLGPQDGRSFLPVAEVRDRLAAAFPIHQFDHDKGREIGQVTLAKLGQLNAPAEVVELYRNGFGEIVWVYLADDPSEDCYLQFTLWPDQPILLGYHSAAHEQQSEPLLRRCAEALAYQIHLA